jgi:serine/threonine protein kinase
MGNVPTSGEEAY